MPGVDTDIVEHHFPLNPKCSPIKPKLRRTHPDMVVKIKEEVLKQINSSFIVTLMYPQWIANIVPVTKKDEKVRMCVDYRDLNKASPKDDFPLPHIEMLVDSITKFKVFSFMDGFSRYNKIIIALEDMEKNNVYHTLGNILLQSDVLRVEEHWCNLPEGYDNPIP